MAQTTTRSDIISQTPSGAFNFATVVLAGVMPFSNRLTVWCILLIGAIWVIEGKTRSKIKTAYNNGIVVFSSIYYLILLSGLLYTNHFSKGFYNAQTEASFLVLPLLYFGYTTLDKETIRKTFWAFTISVLLSSLYCLSIALFRFYYAHNISLLFYHTLVKPIDQHAVYFSIYVFISIAFLFYQLKQKVSRRQIIGISILLLYLLGFLFLLRSKIVIATMLLYIVGQLLSIASKKFRGIRYRIAIPAMLMTICLLFIFNTSNPFSRQMHQLELTNYDKIHSSRYDQGDYFNEIELRLVLWRFAVQILNETNSWILGTNTGDAQSKIDQKIVGYNMYTGIPGTSNHGYLDYNLHNQYMESLLRTGIIGLTILLGIVVLLFRSSIRHKNELLFAVLIIFATSFTTESVLERQFGIVPFFFFVSILAVPWKDNRESEIANKEKIKIFVDAHCFDSSYQGTRTFIKGIYSVLMKRNDIVVYLGAHNIEQLKKEFPGLPEDQYVKYKFKNRLTRLLWEIPRILKRQQFDYAHFQYIIPVTKTCRYIVTTHDVLFMDFKNDFPWHYRFLRNITFRYSFRMADIRTTPSEYSRERLSYHYKTPLKKIQVVPNGISSRIASLQIDKKRSREYIEKQYGIHDFILFVSRIEPRKNHHLLLRSYLDTQLYKEGISIVFIGSRSLASSSFDTEIANLKPDIRKRIFILDNIPDDELVQFYIAAKVFVYPSKAEGFGIPPLEAAALQTPVLCSNVTAMSEYIFFQENHFNPSETKKFQEQLIKTIKENKLEELKGISQMVIKRYSWENSARELLNCIA